mmetsp:Transcript_1410/g.2051  ORF Transcript_1410/g.2051 Transcript_1410/m.2051 type:complete len:295 (-) Transcript_1410:114-998(-)|eukprot:CAMPEP_0203675444 /NCGR_PEP_ID=MMETSP0090-20130426/20429_1 /ASSEMBLY_ACC=CAM_ASM_001088 /TAXON_ID=426623 /ORGANISM="Chaetoceros affinis, Strain CCMP159" /LENGTH=294 /DNA_ID=CAMNT_0050541641 /DNA_START=66 /DNA_END=950 /DNA_ORIENTATION=+
MAPSSSTVILAAAGSAALILAAKTVFKPSEASTTSSTSTTAATQAQLDSGDCIQPDDVIAIFDELFIHMQSVVAQLSQQIQQIQMAGQSIPEPQLRGLLKGEFERSLKAKQSSIFEKHDVDEDCLREATWEFMTMAANGEGGEEVAKVKKVVERFQKLYENVSGEKVVGRLPGDGKDKNAAETAVAVSISKEQLIQAAKIYFDALTNVMATIVAEAKAEGKDLRNPQVAQEMQIQFAEKVTDAGEEALKGEGLSTDDFKAAIEKYANDPQVGRTLQMLQIKQQQELMAMGVPTM